VGTNPLVSVIIPACNAQDLIAETLDSILAQTYENIEIIVVDDGSTDKTFQIVEGYGSRVRYYYQKNSGGCAVPRNTGIGHASGDLICFIDADDIMVPDRIAQQVDFLERHSHVSLVFSDYLNFNEDGPYPISHFQTCPRLWPLLRGQEELILEKAGALLSEENFGITGAFMLRKKLLAIEVGFEPTLKACEDFHFYFRLARHTPVGIINKVSFLRRLHGNNMSGNPSKMLSEGIRTRTWLRDSGQDPMIRAHLNAYIAGCHGAFARYHADQGHYLLALRYDVQALYCNSCWSRLCTSCRNLARTILLAAGLLKHN